MLFFVSNSIFAPFRKSLLTFSVFLYFPSLPFFFSLFHIHPSPFVGFPDALSHTHYIPLSFCSSFIYIMGGLHECRNDCVQGEGDNSYLYSYLGRIQWGKIFTGFVEGCCISCIHFPCPAECSEAMYRIIPCSVFWLDRKTWSKTHFKRGCESRLNEIPNSEPLFLVHCKTTGDNTVFLKISDCWQGGSVCL